MVKRLNKPVKGLILKKSRHGIGVFAGKNFSKGEFIIEFSGKIHKIKDNPKGWNSKSSHYIQIGKDVCLGPTRTLDNYINHSCSPNSGLKISANVPLFAIRNIRKGEEITLDYSTTMHNDDWELDCTCSSRNCRKKVKEFSKLPEKTQQKYVRMEIVPEYVLESLDWLKFNKIKKS